MKNFEKERKLILSYSDNLCNFNNKSILLTGGTGSFGLAFTDFVAKNYSPKRLVIFSRDELKQYEMQIKTNLKNKKFLRYFIGDIRDKSRLNVAMRDIDYVIHAAALKRIEVAEYNPFECVKTNILGSQNVIDCAIQNKVKVIALSTDKATNPSNLYGASKLASEKLFVAANNIAGSTRTRFCAVRYGNVLGSRGSVLNIFNDCINQKSDVFPITDKKMTRFWISLNRGVSFVISCLEIMNGGEIFIPKIPSSKVVDLAKALDKTKKFKIIGMRPGEKLHEELISKHESPFTLELDDRFIIEPALSWWGNQEKKKYKGIKTPKNFLYSSENNLDVFCDKKMRYFVQNLNV